MTPAENLALSRHVRNDPTAALLAQVRDALSALLQGLAALTLPEAPVAAPIVNVDLSPLLMAVDALTRRIESLPAPVVTVQAPEVIVPQTTVAAGPAIVVPDTVHIHPDDLDALRDVLGEVTISEQTLRALAQAMAGNRNLIGGGGPRNVATNAKLDEVIVAIEGGSSAVAAYALRFDDTGTYTYVGEAAPGTAEATAGWRVKRLTNSDNTIVWAGGTADFGNAWTGHAGLTYS